MAVSAPPRPRAKHALKPIKHKVALWLLAGMLILMLGVAIISATGGGLHTCAAASGPSSTAKTVISADLLAIYVRAEQQYGVPWSLLAAINSVESDFGRTAAASSAGALGPMQFKPSTWARYGVDANADGVKDIMDPEDAIPGAANYLTASGAPQDMQSALFAYNHAQWYVDKVLALAQTFATGGDCTSPTGNASAQAVFTAANELEAMHVPYNYGGGHVTPAVPGPGADGPLNGLDCSSAVSWVLQHAGIKVATLGSKSFMSWGDPGPGAAVTLYANPTHVFMSILVAGHVRYFGTSGFGHPEAGGGAAWFTQPVSASYIASFTQRHPPGL